MLLPLDEVFIDRNFNVRIFYGDIDALAVSLMTEGQREPITVRRDGARFLVVDGHRRHRAMGRARNLEIVAREGGFQVCEEGRAVRPSPGPVHPRFDPERILCRVVEGDAPDHELVASQLSYNSGKPFTLLERMILISRLARMEGGISREQLALRTGFSRTYVANAQHLHAADPRLLDFVRDGRLSQKLALRLLRTFSADQQIARVAAAAGVARVRGREKILPKDIAWGGTGDTEAAVTEPPGAPAAAVDAVKVRLRNVAQRLDGAERYAPNPAAAERLGALRWVHQYAIGKVSYARLEAYLLGRE